MERLERYKFKGQRIDNGEWVYGGYFGCSEEDGFVHYIYTGYDGAVAVRPETVAQFTGLLDKNDDEVYEGDKIKYSHNWDYINGKREFATKGKNKGYEIGYVMWESPGMTGYNVTPNRMCLYNDRMLIELVK